MRVLVDMDGVLYDWSSIYLKLYQELSGEELPLSFHWEWYFMRQLPNTKAKSAITKSSRLWTDGLPCPGALDGLRALCSTHDTYIATQPGPRPDIAVPGKVAWLKKVAPWFNVERLICIRDKELLLADALIDDRLRNLVSWKAVNPQGIALLMVRPWNVIEAAAESWFLSQSSGIGTVYDLFDAARLLPREAAPARAGQSPY
jgi:5'(3')-deoxyribonucleotidase